MTVDLSRAIEDSPLYIKPKAATGIGRIYKYGRICVLTAALKPTTIGINLCLGWIPSTHALWKPIGDTWLSCDYYANNNTSTAEARILASDGSIIVSTQFNNNELKISGVWITVS